MTSEAGPDFRGLRVVQRLREVRYRRVSPLKKPVVRHHLYKSMKHGYYLPSLSRTSSSHGLHRT